MRVLLTGATGNVGSRLLPSLIAHGHQVIVYVRDPAKLSNAATSLATAVLSGSGTDTNSIKNAISSHNCDAVINAAGLAPMFGQSGELPAIFAAVLKAALEISEQRTRQGQKPLRIWLLSGFGILDAPKDGKMMIDYLPLFTIHKQNYELIRHVPTDQLAWSLFCANQMDPRSQTVNYSPTAGFDAQNLIAGVDVPPAWSKTLQWVPLVGTFLNIMVQVQKYFAPLEDCVDFIAADIAAGVERQYVGHRVAVKVRPQAT